MSELSHTKEPWSTEYRQSAGGYAQEIFDADGQVIATAAWYIVQVSPETIATNREQNARRIVACVNRLARFTTEQIEDHAVDLLGANDWFNRYDAAMREMQALRLNNGQLLDALEALIDMDVAYQRGPKVEQAVNTARAVISAAKGGATC